VTNPLCSGPRIDGTIDSHTGQHAAESPPVNIVGDQAGARAVLAGGVEEQAVADGERSPGRQPAAG